MNRTIKVLLCLTLSTFSVYHVTGQNATTILDLNTTVTTSEASPTESASSTEANSTMETTESMPMMNATDEPTALISTNDTEIIANLSEAILPDTSSPTVALSNEPSLVQPSAAPTETSSPTRVPIDIAKELVSCRDIQSSNFHYCPPHRYCHWEGQTLSVKAWLTEKVAYTKTTWDYVATNEIEDAWFEDLPEDQREALEEMGIDLERHECCYNHYELYGWRMFDRWGMTDQKAAWEAVGYDEEKWNGGLETEYTDFWFEDLPEEVQFALTEYLCYTAELWNQVPLDFWPEDATLPGTYPLEEEEEEVDTDPMDGTEGNKTMEEEDVESSTAFSFGVGLVLNVFLHLNVFFFAWFSL